MTMRRLYHTTRHSVDRTFHHNAVCMVSDVSSNVVRLVLRCALQAQHTLHRAFAVIPPTSVPNPHYHARPRRRTEQQSRYNDASTKIRAIPIHSMHIVHLINTTPTRNTARHRNSKLSTPNSRPSHGPNRPTARIRPPYFFNTLFFQGRPCA